MITYEQALAGLEKALDQRGADYVYPRDVKGCVYNNDGAPSCIVGQMVFNIDPDLFHELSVEEQMNNYSLAACEIDTIEFAPGVQDALNLAQVLQDTGGSWGSAVERFKDKYPHALVAETVGG